MGFELHAAQAIRPVTSKDRRGLVKILKNKPGWLVNVIKHVCGATY